MFRAESMDLYLEACQFDPNLIPFKAEGPTQTPPIKDYIQVLYMYKVCHDPCLISWVFF